MLRASTLCKKTPQRIRRPFLKLHCLYNAFLCSRRSKEFKVFAVRKITHVLLKEMHHSVESPANRIGCLRSNFTEVASMRFKYFKNIYELI